MNRALLIEALDTVEAAVAVSDVVPILATYVFTGRRVMASSNYLALAAPLQTDFTGCLPKAFGTVIRSLKPEEIDLQPDAAGVMHVKAASTKVQFPMMPREDFTVTFPPADDDAAIDVDLATFAVALEHCVRASKISERNTSEYMGVNIVIRKGQMHLFGSDRQCIAYASIPCKHTTKQSDEQWAILPFSFCKAVIKQAKSTEPFTLEINDRHAFATFGDVWAYSALLTPEINTDWLAIVTQAQGEAEARKFDIPTKLQAVLDRAVVAAGSDGETVISVKAINNKQSTIQFDTKGTKIAATDSCLAEHVLPDLKVTARPQLLAKNLKRFDAIAVLGEMIVLTGNELTLMVAADEIRMD